MTQPLLDELPEALLQAAAEPTPWEAIAGRQQTIALPDPAAALDFATPGSDPSHTAPSSGDEPPNSAETTDRSLWRPRLEAIAALLAAAGLSAPELRGRLLPALPQLARLEPVAVAAALEFLEGALGGTEVAVAAILEEPSLLACSVEEHLAPAMQFLETMAGAPDALAAGRMAAESPPLLRWAVEGSLRERRLQAASRAASSASMAAAAALARGATEVRAARGRPGVS